MSRRTLALALPVTLAFRIQVLVPSLWRHQKHRHNLRQSFLECQFSNVDLEQHFFMGEATTSEAKKELMSFTDLVVFPFLEEDPEMQTLVAQREAEAETSLGQQVLDRPSPAALRLLHSLAWLNRERPGFDMVLKLEDMCEVPLLGILEQVLLHTEQNDAKNLLLGEIIEDFPLTVPVEVDEACETCEVPVEAERFCLEMIQISMSGMDMRGCLRIALECCSGPGGCNHNNLASCTATAREVGMDTVMYFGTAFQ